MYFSQSFIEGKQYQQQLIYFVVEQQQIIYLQKSTSAAALTSVLYRWCRHLAKRSPVSANSCLLLALLKPLLKFLFIFIDFFQTNSRRGLDKRAL